MLTACFLRPPTHTAHGQALSSSRPGPPAAPCSPSAPGTLARSHASACPQSPLRSLSPAAPQGPGALPASVLPVAACARQGPPCPGRAPVLPRSPSDMVLSGTGGHEHWDRDRAGSGSGSVWKNGDLRAAGAPSRGSTACSAWTHGVGIPRSRAAATSLPGVGARQGRPPSRECLSPCQRSEPVRPLTQKSRLWTCFQGTRGDRQRGRESLVKALLRGAIGAALSGANPGALCRVHVNALTWKTAL